jgi:hypothetical protein
MEKLYADKRIFVCLKPVGVASTDQPGGLPELVRRELGEEMACVRTVHRLDQVVGGVMVLARSRVAAQLLSEQMRQGRFEKEYLAVAQGSVEPPEDTLRDLLRRDKARRRTFVTDTPGQDVREAVLQSRFRSYPVLNEKERVVGTLSRFHLLRPRRKRVVLVDHNEKSQSVPGLEQAEILAIIDHHRLADIQTGNPIYVRNEPVGSTTTIVAEMYQDRGLMPAEKMAGLMAAAMVSDTVMFKSPTCTQRDWNMANRMARIAHISLETLG